MKKLTAICLLLVMLGSILAGCGNQNTTPSASPSASTESTSPQSSENASETRVITDMAGRTVTIPATINSVYCSVPTAEAMVCTLIPEKLMGWVNQPSDEVMKYLTPELASLPVLGGWMGQQVTANMEDIIKAAPDVIIYMGDVVYSGTMDTTVPEEIQKQTNIPVICVSNALKDTAEVYRILGDYLGVPERGNTLAEYCETKMAEISEAVSKIPESERVSVYYAEGNTGLATDPTGSDHTEVLDFLQMKNVADVEKLPGQGMSEVSIEQVINWNPDVILVSGGYEGAYTEVTTNSIWSDIKAVQDGKVYVTPRYPFNWFDRPPNIMRVLGMQWFGNLIYPDYIKIDINQEIKDFYSLFYNVELTDQDIAELTFTGEQ